jgi:hypothetical protein
VCCSGDSQFGWVFKNENPFFSLTKKNEKPLSHVTKVTLGKMKTHSCHENENPRGTQMCGEEVFLQVVTFSLAHVAACVAADAKFIVQATARGTLKTPRRARIYLQHNANERE